MGCAGLFARDGPFRGRADGGGTGAIKCWGYNALGQLGLGDATNRGTDPAQMGDALPG